MATTCLFGTTDEKGRFSFVVDAPAEVAIKTREDLDANPRRGAALCPVRVLGSSSVDVGDVHVPTLATGSSIATADRDPQTLVAGAGVELVLSRSQLVSSGHPLTDVAAAAVPKQEIPMLTDLAGEKVVAAFALHPFGVKSNAPIAFKAPVNLPNGTVVKIRTISDLDGRLSGAVPGRAEDGFVTTDPGRGITELTWVVIST